MRKIQTIFVAGILLTSAACNDKKQRSKTPVIPLAEVKVIQKTDDKKNNNNSLQSTGENKSKKENEIALAIDQVGKVDNEIEIQEFSDGSNPIDLNRNGTQNIRFAKSGSSLLLELNQEDSKFLMSVIAGKAVNHILEGIGQSIIKYTSEKLSCSTFVKDTIVKEERCLVQLDFTTGEIKKNSGNLNQKKPINYSNIEASKVFKNGYTGANVNLAPLDDNERGLGYIFIRGVDARILYHRLESSETSNDYSEYVTSKRGIDYTCHRVHSEKDFQMVSYVCSFKYDYVHGEILSQE